LIRVLCGRIELGKDNEELLGLLSQFADSDIEGITSVLQEFDTAIQTAAAAQAQIAKDKLASEHFISGSAVLPNLESDPAWRQMAEEIQVQYSRLLEEEKAKISEGR
jgi:RNA polymerase-interacting CarD/CdnL/TRCF family regulator